MVNRSLIFTILEINCWCINNLIFIIKIQNESTIEKKTADFNNNKVRM
jgi:hypothetical protein